MEAIVKQVAEKVGVDEATVAKVLGYVQENPEMLQGLLAKSGLADKLPGGLGGKLGGLLGGDK